MNKHFTLLIIAILAGTFLCSAQVWKTYPYHQPGSVITFPADEGYHPGSPVEWWYTNAHLTGNTSGIDYSYMLTYFYYPKFGYDGYRFFDMANETTGTFITETQPCKYPTLAQDHLNIQSNTGVSGATQEQMSTLTDANNNLIPFQYHVKATSPDKSIDLIYSATKRPLMIGGTGFLKEGSSTSTYYYSQTNLDVTGTITYKGVKDTVHGIAWIDRQWGAIDLGTNEQYAWLSLQLSNGTDLNLWNLYNPQNQIPNDTAWRFCTAYINDTTASTITNFTLQRLKYAYTRDSVKCYDQKWRLKYGNTDLIITAANIENEVKLPFRFYEGSVSIAGTIDGVAVTGLGFAELLHSFVKPQTNITAPTTSVTWSPSQPITWQLKNTDDGRPIYYDVTVSTDNKASFSPITQDILDTSYRWTPPASLQKGTQLWFAVNAYSIDGTLTDTVISSQSYTYQNGVLALSGLKLSGKSLSNLTYLLNWSIVGTVDADTYKIKRSIDGVNFIEINHFSSALPTVQSNYQYLVVFDNLAQKTNEVYFKVEGYKEGKIVAGSNIIILKRLSNLLPDVIIYPNPASTNVVASLYYIKGEKLSMQLMNELGTVIQKPLILNTVNGFNNIKFSLASEPPGIYYLLLNDNKLTKSYKIVKQ